MKYRLICAAAACIVAAAAVCGTAILCHAAQDRPAVGIDVPGISDTVEGFCQSLENGDYAALEELIHDYSSLGLTDEPESENAKTLLEYLRGSYQCEPVGDGSTVGMTAEQDISVSYFSVSMAEETVRQRTQELFNQRMEAAQSNEELYDEYGNVLQSVAFEIYDQALTEMLQNADQYMVSQTVTVELVFEDGRWQIVLSQSIIDILLGGINKL